MTVSSKHQVFGSIIEKLKSIRKKIENVQDLTETGIICDSSTKTTNGDPDGYNCPPVANNAGLYINSCLRPRCEITAWFKSHGKVFLGCSCPSNRRPYLYNVEMSLTNLSGSFLRSVSGINDYHGIINTSSLQSGQDLYSNKLSSVKAFIDFYDQEKYKAIPGHKIDFKQQTNIGNVLSRAAAYIEKAENTFTVDTKVLKERLLKIDGLRKQRDFLPAVLEFKDIYSLSNQIDLLVYSGKKEVKETKSSSKEQTIDKETHEEDRSPDENSMNFIFKILGCEKGKTVSQRKRGNTIALRRSRYFKYPVLLVSNEECLRKLCEESLGSYSFDKCDSDVKLQFLTHGRPGFRNGNLPILRPLTNIELNRLDMNIYFNRLSTFADWPIENPISPIKLAEAGFIYRGNGQTVECFTCGLSVSDFPPDSSPIDIHQALTEECGFLRSVGKTPLGTNAASSARAGINSSVAQTDSEHNQAIQNMTHDFQETLNLTNNEYDMDSEANCIDRKKINPSAPMITSQGMNSQSMDSIATGDNNATTENRLSITRSNNDLNGLERHLLSEATAAISSMTSATTLDTQQSTVDDISNINDNILGSAKHPQYIGIHNRLETFRSWSFHNIQQPRNLVDAGFYHIGKEDIVRCFFCDIGLAEWDKDDDPWVEHARHSPQCLYVKQKRGDEFIENIQASWRQIYCPKHEEYQDYTTRLQSFRNWPSDISQRPEQLASAGFFYTGTDDTVRCHYCDGGLRQWDQDDVPWVEHARWFPFCKFLVKIKGINFIEEVTRTYNNMYANQGDIQNGTSNTTENSLGQSNSNANRTKCQDALATAAAQSVLEMGYSEGRVNTAINEHIKRTGNRDFNAENIMEIILELDDDFKTKDLKPDIPDEDIANVMDDIKNMDFSNIDTTQLRKINMKMKNDLFLCKYCKVKDRNMVFIPCGHRIACESCAKDKYVCLVCNAFVKKSVKTYMS